MQNIDPLEIANILATELWCQQVYIPLIKKPHKPAFSSVHKTSPTGTFSTLVQCLTLCFFYFQLANLEGLQSGVPTRTTATITPTQLRNFEQTYIELTNCRSDQATHAGFVPPSITHANNYGMLNSVGYCDSGPTTALHVSPGPLSASGDSMSSSPGLPMPKRRNMGGRRPNKPSQDISPEEEDRRKVRRERNKMAAARCRKRRLDHTNELQDETDKLEEKKQSLQEEIRKLNSEGEQLRSVLESHMLSCRLLKRTLYLFRIMLSAANPAVVTSPSHVSLDTPPAMSRPNRPNSLQVPLTLNPAQVCTSSVSSASMRTTQALPTQFLRRPMVLPTQVFSESRWIMLSAANPAVVTSPSHVSLDTPPAMSRPNRPNSLQVPLTLNPAQMHNNKALGNNKIAGIEISTPSNGIPFNFESIMEGGTGLTPVHPHPYPCAHQQRAAPEVSSPDAQHNLVSL
ncbi:Kayak isoform A [Operophtera brumata]|uniref:Kayak isoform A n=1 Tax=Operophtera brumata TaxID=104452 RepID=A0A0L7L5X4_OPEBR|nr:Kayak isoform A [Operophtera brumata]